MTQVQSAVRYLDASRHDGFSSPTVPHPVVPAGVMTNFDQAKWLRERAAYERTEGLKRKKRIDSFRKSKANRRRRRLLALLEAETELGGLSVRTSPPIDAEDIFS